jgi:hypothetical protein
VTDTEPDGALAFVLSEVRQCLQAVAGAHQEDRDDDRWKALRELLDRLHLLDDVGERRLGPVTWSALRASSPGGRTFAALVWVHSLAQLATGVEGLAWVRSARFVYLGEGRWEPASTVAAGAAEGSSLHGPVLLWPQFVDLPPGSPEDQHRDEWYERLVAMRQLDEPLRAAVEWLDSTMRGAGRT